MANECFKLQTMAQVKYMNYLTDLATKLATERAQKKERLAFDPQGRVLIDVTLSDKQLEGLIDKITNNAGNKSDVRKENLNILTNLLGRKVSLPTTVSLDCTANPLREKFENQLKDLLTKKNNVNDLSAQSMIEKLRGTPKGSIIALQQEFHFHLALVARVYQKNTGLSNEKMQEIHEKTMTAVNKLVMDTYAKALLESVDDKDIDIAKLNKHLDKARKELLPKAHRLMAKEVLGQAPQAKDKILALSSSKLKHEAEKLTATANDILHLDNGQGLATLIAGSEQTAHNKSMGSEFAHRQLITCPMEGGQIKEPKNPRIQIRTPSISAATTRIYLSRSEKPYVEDVAQKLDKIREDYQLNLRLEDSSMQILNIKKEPVQYVKPKAFTYNLHTAINHTFDDLQGKNLQSQSAVHILKGAHKYNQQEMATHWASNGEYKPVLCYVQNISVNGFGDQLGYKPWLYRVLNIKGHLRTEATLMTELSMLNTMYEAVSTAHKARIHEIIDQYKRFLEDRDRPEFFSDSPEGEAVIESIKNLKDDIKQQLQPQKLEDGQPKIPDNDVHFNAKLALRNIMANNLHFQDDYAKLTQALSVFSEEASISGCKSGNERAQAINGRVAILDSLVNGKPLSEEREKLAKTLQNLAQATTTEAISQHSAALNLALHTAYNKEGLQGAASIVSLVDQGASAKVEASVSFSFKNLFKYIASLFNANYGEENAAIMTNLHQGKAGKMQAHKDMGKQMKEAFTFTAEVQAHVEKAVVAIGSESSAKMLGGLTAHGSPNGNAFHSIARNLQSSAPEAVAASQQPRPQETQRPAADAEADEGLGAGPRA